MGVGKVINTYEKETTLAQAEISHCQKTVGVIGSVLGWDRMWTESTCMSRDETFEDPCGYYIISQND